MGDHDEQKKWYDDAARAETEAAARPEPTWGEEAEKDALNGRWPAGAVEEAEEASGDWKQRLRFESGEEHFVEDQLAFAYVLEKLKDHADPPQECQFDLPPNQEWVFEVRCPIGNCRYGKGLIAKRSTWQEAVGQLLWHMLKDP